MSNNPFSNAIAKTGGAMAQATESREVAEIQAAMVIAKRFPRDQMHAMDRILNACTRKTLAETALYSYNRGGQEVTGPSIRLAEVLAQAWGNLQIGVRELDQTDGASTVEAFAWDLETNTRDAKVFQVAHERHTKSGTKKLTDPRDIYEAVANVGARRKRACILAVIPGDVVEAAVAQCDVTLAANADTGSDAVKRLLDAFAEFGVTREQIEARLTNRVDAIRPAQMVSLRKIFASLRDGISTPIEWFAVSEARTVVEEIRSKVAEKPQNVFVAKDLPPKPKTHMDGPVSFHVPVSKEEEAKIDSAVFGPDSNDWPKDYKGNLYDARGVVWDGVVHSGAKSCNTDGTWRRRKGVTPAHVAEIELRYPKIDPLTAFGGGPAVESGGKGEPEPLELDGSPGIADVLTWIAEATDLEQLDLAVDAAKDCDLTQDDRQQVNAAAAAQRAALIG